MFSCELQDLHSQLNEQTSVETQLGALDVEHEAWHAELARKNASPSVSVHKHDEAQ